MDRWRLAEAGEALASPPRGVGGGPGVDPLQPVSGLGSRGVAPLPGDRRAAIGAVEPSASE